MIWYPVIFWDYIARTNVTIPCPDESTQRIVWNALKANGYTMQNELDEEDDPPISEEDLGKWIPE